MKKILIALSIPLFLSCTPSIFGQGLNNDYEVDKKDIQQVLDILKIDIHKFNLDTIKEVEHWNVVIYNIFNDHIDTIDLALKMKPYLSKYGPSLLPSKQNDQDNLFRFYFSRKDSAVLLTFLLNENPITLDFDFSKINAFGSRTFDTPILTDKKSRILAFYGVEDSSKELHCALNDSNHKLQKRMDRVIIVNIEPYKK